MAATKEQLKSRLVLFGWNLDRYGNLKKQAGKSLYRIKFQANSVRLEKQYTIDASPYSKESKEWVRVTSSYYKDIMVHDDRVIIGTIKVKMPTNMG